MKIYLSIFCITGQAVIAIVAILIVQAYCDLSLPAYTSDIVNVGILQGGIEDKAPTAFQKKNGIS